MTERPALVFDLDGTLIDSSEGVVAAFNYSLAAMGQPEQPAEMIKKYIGYPLSDVYPRFTSAPLSELYHHFQIKARETVVSSTVALGGVTAALRHLHRDGWLMAIATTKIRAHVDGIIDKLGWSGYFAALVGGDEVEHVKPAPDAFHLALRRMGAEAADALVVGDTINDIYAAHAVPMIAVAVEPLYDGRDELLSSRPDYMIADVAALPSFLESGAYRG